jgi:hypothetical protein
LKEKEFEGVLNRVLRISGPKKESVRGGWRKLHSEEKSFKTK